MTTLLVIQDGVVLATHPAAMRKYITFSLYLGAEKIIEIVEGVTVDVGDPDPSIAHPEYVVSSQVPSILRYGTLTFAGGSPIVGLKADGTAIQSIQFGQETLTAAFTIYVDKARTQIDTAFSGNWIISLAKVRSLPDPKPIDSTLIPIVIAAGQGSVSGLCPPSTGVWLVDDNDLSLLYTAAGPVKIVFDEAVAFFVY